MRDHLLGFPSNVEAVADACAYGEYFGLFADRFPLGVPTRVCDEWMARNHVPPALRAALAFERVAYPFPDGRFYDVGKVDPASVVYRAAAAEEAAKEGARAALLVALKARTPEQAADRIGEAFAHMATARGGAS